MCNELSPPAELQALVEQLGARDWKVAEAALAARGEAGIAAAIWGLSHPNVRVRVGCAGFMAHHGTDACFAPLWQVALHEYDDQMGIEWDRQSIDGSMTKAPLEGIKDGQKPYGSGQNRHQAVGSDRWSRGSGGSGGRRGQPTRYEAGRDDSGEYSCRAPRADGDETAAPVRG